METNGEGAVAKVEAKKPVTIIDYLESPKIKNEIAKALSGSISPDRILRVMMTSIRSNPALAKCSTESIMGSLMVSAQLGLEPNTPLGQAYILPYFNSKTGQHEAQFQLGYAGVLELAYRTGEYKSISVREVYVNDYFEYWYGLDPDLKHIPAEVPEGEPVKYYAAYRLKNGGSNFEVWSVDKCRLHAQRFSRASQKGTSPWQTDEPAMCKKTVLRAVLKYAPKTVELAERITAEEIEEHTRPPMAGAAFNEITVNDAPAIEAPEHPAIEAVEMATEEQLNELSEAAMAAGFHPDEVMDLAEELYGIKTTEELTGPMAEALIERYARSDTSKPMEAMQQEISPRADSPIAPPAAPKTNRKVKDKEEV